MSRALRAHSIALPIFLLVIAAIIAATAITFAITFAGPPPRPAPVALADVAGVLRGEHHINAEGLRVIAAAGRKPAPRVGERADPARDRFVAGLLGRGEVIGFYEQPARGADSALRGSFTIGWRDGDGWRVVRSPPDRMFTRWLTFTLGGMVTAMVVMAYAAWLIARAISRPLSDLARDASSLQLADAPPAATQGPREVRALSAALTTMHGRLAQHAKNRTAMLAAIAHDLGTPLSRIAFWIEQLPESARVRAVGDIHEMRAMLGDVLRYARDERTGDRVKVDLGSVLDALVDDLSVAGQPVLLEAGSRALVHGHPSSLRRLFVNLVENAVRYGEVARVGWSIEHAEVIVTIDDDGPGFDPALGDRLFEPFVRGDPSRNRATGGTGLGLAIVRSLTEAHGGSISLGRTRHGGRVAVRLPLA